MLLFVKWTSSHMTPAAQADAATRYSRLRMASLVGVTSAAIFEILASTWPAARDALPYSRWAVAALMLLLSALYFTDRPWNRFVEVPDP
jgi:hypothetical protein